MFKSFVLILSVLSLTDLSTTERQPRVIGGGIASPGQFPYQVSVHKNGIHNCGGSIISLNAIITAAHCVIGQHPANLKVLAGTNNLNSGGVRANVERYTVHPRYNVRNQDNDIAIVYLRQHLPIGSNPNVQNIQLVDSTTQLTAGQVGTLSGWGQDRRNIPSLFPGYPSYSPPHPTQLKYARIPLWSGKDCAARLYPNYILTPNTYCAGSYDGQISSCPGDSGGPLVVNGKLAGVVSWGLGCGAQAPAMYTNLVALRPWIKQNTGI